MLVLLACYHTEKLRECIEANGHTVHSCDLKPSRVTSGHFIQDVLTVVPGKYDAMIAFPPCTYLAKAQFSRTARDPERQRKRDEAMNFVKSLDTCGIKKRAIENPIGYLNSHWRQCTQIVRPWFFGDPYTKDVCLWLNDLPPLIATCYNPKRKWIGNHVNGRMSSTVKSEIKSSWNYFPGMCQAIADQWFPKC